MNDIAVIEDEPKKAEDMLPPGMFKLSDGRMIERHRVCFGMQQHKEHTDIFYTMDGHIYQKQKNGSLKRLTYKKGEKRT